jgi:membrane associated rhomboid family serine protease
VQFSYTLLLVVVTTLISFFAYENRTWFERLSFRPYDIKRNKGEAFRFLAHGFIHADFVHLFFNMFVLYNFGVMLEGHLHNEYGVIGLYYFVLLYFGGIVFGTLPAFAKHKDNIMYSSVGASGGTTALVFSYIAFRPLNPLGGIFIPGIPAIIFGILILGAEYYLSKRGRTNIAHDAHIYGALYGFAFTLFLDKEIWYNFISTLKNAF